MRPTIPELAVREAAPGEDLLRRRNSCREVSAFSLKKEAEAGWLRPKIMRLLCGGTEGAAAVGGRGIKVGVSPTLQRAKSTIDQGDVSLWD